ncbi:MAG: PHP domain-containing protein [Kiritimatiellia bacterium]|jgi:predicted metal-dependent phosphoesterase TrpH
MIDLHIHSTFSDGTFTPEELVELGTDAGLSAMALTDHDTAAGVPRFLAAAKAKGMRAVSGVELSVDVPGVAVHILAYGCDPGHAPLGEALAKIRDARHRRNVEIIARLVRLGCGITWKDVTDAAGDGGVIARPHFAQALVKRGYARSRQDAFRRYLAKGAPAYVDRFRLEPEEALRLVADAGGVSALAHPMLCGLDSTLLRDLVAGLASIGLGGIETYYTGHTVEQVDALLGLAEEYNLVPTGGTDFHGDASPQIQIGTAFGSLRVPDDSFDRLLERMPKAS